MLLFVAVTLSRNTAVPLNISNIWQFGLESSKQTSASSVAL